MTASPRYLRRYWAVLVIAAGLYVLTAGTTLLRSRTGAHTEIFPIFSWDLFSVVPNEATDYGLRIVSLDGRPLPHPAFLETLSGVGTTFHVATHMAIQELAAAQRLGDTQRVRDLQRVLRANYLGGRHREVGYELVARRYNVLERYRTGQFKALNVVDLEAPP